MTVSRNICYDDGSRVVRLAILRTGGDGSLYVICPDHPWAAGTTYKLLAPLGIRADGFVPMSDRVAYLVPGRAKLSFHPDGLVQLSSEEGGNLISGKSRSGELKGLGIQTDSVLRNPVLTGSTFGISVWGIDQFPSFASQKAEEDAVIGQDWIHPVPHIFPSRAGEEATAVHFAFFLFPRWREAQVGIERGRRALTQIRHWVGNPKCDLYTFRVVDLGLLHVFVGILAYRSSPSSDAPAGIMFGGPRDQEGRGFSVLYPALSHTGLELPSLGTQGLSPSDDTRIAHRDYWPRSVAPAPAKSSMTGNWTYEHLPGCLVQTGYDRPDLQSHIERVLPSGCHRAALLRMMARNGFFVTKRGIVIRPD